MNKVDNEKHESVILDQATKWVVELNSGELSVARAEMLHEWIRESPMHEASLLKASDIWDETNVLVAETKPVPRPIKSIWSYKPGFAIAAVLLVTIFGVFLSNVSNLVEDDQTNLITDYETRVGEFRTIILSDSSSVILNTNSRISVAFNEQSEIRRINLLQGEAYFDVAKDAQRPFVVNVNKREIRAVGTAFNIKSKSNFIEVLVKDCLLYTSPSPRD